MNPVFWFLILSGAALLWLLLSFLFRPLGRVSKRLVDDAKREMFEEEKNKTNEETKEK